MKKIYLALTFIAASIIQLSLALDLPKNMTLEYSGPYGIPAKLTFKHDHKNYAIETTIPIPFNRMQFKASGTIHNNPLLPTEYLVLRDKNLYASSVFDYANNLITVGRLPTRNTSKLPKNTQDLFSIAWQMAINTGLPNKNTHATDGKRLYELPTLNSITPKTQTINGKKQSIPYFKGGEGNRQLEIGLAQALHYVPSIIVYYDKGKRYELTLKRVTFND